MRSETGCLSLWGRSFADLLNRHLHNEHRHFLQPFSIDNGRTWQDHISFSDLAPLGVTDQFDMVKARPNKLVLAASDAEGTKVWPIIVERVKVSPNRVALQGRVLDRQGNPIAGAQVERGPNRYALDA